MDDLEHVSSLSGTQKDAVAQNVDSAERSDQRLAGPQWTVSDPYPTLKHIDLQCTSIGVDPIPEIGHDQVYQNLTSHFTDGLLIYMYFKHRLMSTDRGAARLCEHTM